MGTRLALVIILLGHLLLVGQALVLTPLWEVGREFEHLEVASWWAREGTMPDLRNLPPRTLEQAAHPPLAPWLYAAGLRLTRLTDVEFLARPNEHAGPDDRSAFLHGADELPPWSAPVRRLAAIRIIGVLAGIVCVLGAFALGRRLSPGHPGVGLGAAALLACNPAFAAHCAAIGPGVLAGALATVSLVGLLRLAAEPKSASARRALGLGLLVGAAHLASLACAFLLAVVAVVAIRVGRARKQGWQIGAFLLGWLLLAGPLFAWNATRYGDPVAAAWVLPELPDSPSLSVTLTRVAAFLRNLGHNAVGELGQRVDIGGPLPVLWAVVAGVGALGLLRRLRARGPATAAATATPLLLGAGVYVAALLVFFLDPNKPRAALALPILPAMTTLLALGWSAWLPARVGAAALAVLAALTAVTQRETLTSAYWPPNRALDAHFVAIDPTGLSPAEAHLPFLRVVEPEAGSRHLLPPTLRWEPDRDLEVRYTAHVTIPGHGNSLRTYEKKGLALRDRYRIPDAIWSQLPLDVPLQVQIRRLPRRSELASTPLDRVAVEVSPPLQLFREAPRSAVDRP